MELENFSGKSEESIRQDFFAGGFMENMRVALEINANKNLVKEQQENGLAYQYQVNRNISFEILRDQFVEICLMANARDDIILQMTKLFKLSKIPIKSGRHIPRPSSHLGTRRRFFMSNRRAM